MGASETAAIVAMGRVPGWPWKHVSRSRETSAPDAIPQSRISHVIAQVSGAAEANAWVLQYLQDHQARFAHDLGHVLARTPAGGTVVDVGAAPFVLSVALANGGLHVQSLDLNPARFQGIVDACGVSVAACDVEAEAWPVPDGGADTVVMFEIFEHLRHDLVGAVMKARAALADGGRLLISTPNLRSFMGLYNFVYRGLSYSCGADLHGEWRKLHVLGHMGHVREYTVWELVPFFEKCGLVVEEVTFRGSYGGELDALLADHPHLSPFLMFTLRKGVGPNDKA